ncbi:MAG: type II toxin-antitoxin system prevent-host-death family antitoxin [Burkholderiales bacterium]
MDYVTVRELREKSGEIWQRVEAGEEFVVTRNGKPFALLVHTEPRAVEDTLRALRLARFGEVVREIQAQSVAQGTDQLTDEDIQAEIDAARREARATALAVAEPSPRRYARRR